MNYSLFAAIAALRTGSWNRIPSFECEESNALADRSGGAPGIGRAIMPGSGFTAKRTSLMTAGSSLVQTATKGFVPSLQAACVVGKLGAQFLTLEQSETKTTVVESASAPAWQPADGIVVAESTLTLGTRTWVPHHCPITITLSGQIVKQGKNVEQYVLTELLREAAAETDRICIRGDGVAGRPIGIVNTPGVTTSTGAGLSYADMVAGQQAVSDANAVLDFDSLGFVATPTVAGILKQREGATASDVMWGGALARGTIDQLPAYATTNCPAGDLIFGDFSNLIVGVFGDNLSFDTDPYTAFQSNIVTLRLWLTLDIQLRSPAGFSVFSGVN